MIANAKRRLATAQALCEKQNIKLTPLRKTVLATLYQQDKPLTAYDLLRLLQETQPDMKPMSVYRILNFLETHHLVHRLNSCQAYVACCMPEQKHLAQWVVCEKCRYSQEIVTPGLQQSIDSVLKTYAFGFSDKSIEIFGICQSCSK